MNILISIVMPSYNSEQTILHSIESVQAQTYLNWELLITDDCSSDQTVEIVRKCAEKDCRIKCIVNENNFGAGFSRNQSIARASGKYVAFLDADDIWLPSKLDEQLQFMENSGALFSYTGYQKFSDSGMGGEIIPPETVTHDQLLYGCVIGCLTVMYNADVLGKQTMPLIRKRQDMGLWLKLLKQCGTAYGIAKVLALYRTDSGMSKNKLSSAKYQWRFYRDVVGLSLIKTTWYFSWYAVNGFIKYRK